MVTNLLTHILAARLDNNLSNGALVRAEIVSDWLSAD